jgi:hypothetical protein
MAPGRNASVGDIIGDDPRTDFSGVGDFDSSDAVDGADLLTWQRGNSPVPLSPEDLADWVAEYGSSIDDIVIEPDTHKVVVQNVNGGIFPTQNSVSSVDLLALYNAGVREFNLVVVSGAFAPRRHFSIQGPDLADPNNPAIPLTFGSGVYIETSAIPGLGAASVPEPTTLVLFGLGLATCMARRSA